MTEQEDIASEITALGTIVETMTQFDEETRFRMGRYLISRIRDTEAWPVDAT